MIGSGGCWSEESSFRGKVLAPTCFCGPHRSHADSISVSLCFVYPFSHLVLKIGAMWDAQMPGMEVGLARAPGENRNGGDEV